MFLRSTPDPRWLGPALALVCVASGALVGCGKLTGDLQLTIVNEQTGAPVAGAAILVGGRSARSDVRGIATVAVSEGAYDLSVEHRAFYPRLSTVTVYNGALAMKTITLRPRPDGGQPSPSPSPSGSPGASPAPGTSPNPSAAPADPRPTPSGGAAASHVRGIVRNEAGAALRYARVRVDSGQGYEGQTVADAWGEFDFASLPRQQKLFVTASAEGYASVRREVTFQAANERVDFTGNFRLKPNPSPSVGPGFPSVKLTGVVQDQQGRDVDGVEVRAEVTDARYPFSATAIAHAGRYTLEVPTALPLRLTAGGAGYGTVQITTTLSSGGGMGLLPSVNFNGGQALPRLSGS